MLFPIAKVDRIKSMVLLRFTGMKITYYKRAHIIYSRNNNLQHRLEGKKNLWIVKPGAMSRGRGKSVYSNLAEIKDLIGGFHASEMNNTLFFQIHNLERFLRVILIGLRVYLDSSFYVHFDCIFRDYMQLNCTLSVFTIHSLLEMKIYWLAKVPVFRKFRTYYDSVQ